MSSSFQGKGTSARICSWPHPRQEALGCRPTRNRFPPDAGATSALVRIDGDPDRSSGLSIRLVSPRGLWVMHILKLPGVAVGSSRLARGTYPGRKSPTRARQTGPGKLGSLIR